ncbi:hypothetical protein HID58_060850 [Brassica napus]|uniref:BnaCnng38290D protein n=4 Tax=Brassica TaxID=3705 RepID=A0A078J5K3_BRANA|nr:PREDICTED: bZIP transcription factor 49 [Brassica oleracea var. oleracea]XP_013742200.1 bZIP transcription factor 49 [Brassica napus]VDD09765.1 unnamed protein product [Brassica oleracea]KAH0884754.1 hypothetical protein HID58_060850 [Brassica napus]CAF1850404.1 unnamed protein product [Brassica napus]CDY61687.1 BnaCnng38290D [Brassica napus]
MAEPAVDSFYNSSFELGNSISDLDVDFELTFEDLYFPSEGESFFIPVEVEEKATTTCKTSMTKRKNEIEEDTSRSYKYRRMDEEDDEKKEARLVRNRESALLSRQRRKHYVEELEDKVKNLQSVITDLNSKVSYFASENATLRHKVGPGKGMCWPPCGMYLGSGQVVPLLPIPRLKPQRSVAKVKKTKKVASVSVLGLLFCLFLFSALAPIIVNVSYGGRVLDVSVNNSSELLVASLFVPRNEKLVKLDGNLIIHSISASEKDTASETKPARRSSDSTNIRDMSKHLNTEKQKAFPSSCSDDSKEKLNSTTSNGEMQQWFREGVAGPMFSSGMCTEVFRFDVSSTSGAIRPASQQPKNTTDTHKGKNNRRILRGGHPLSDSNLTKDQNNSSKDNFSTTKPFPSMVVSVLTDPREEGSDEDINGVTGDTKSLSRLFIVVLVDSVKYVTYSCVLPRPEEVPHLVTT